MPSSSSASDAALVAHARAGDASAFATLVRRHLPAAHAVARAIVIERADAEDVCQDVFASLFSRLDECRPAETFRPWLLRSIRNRAISHTRWRRVRATDTLGTGPGEQDFPAPGESPLGAAERADLRTRLSAALATLPETHRTVVVLHDVDGWLHREIAALLDVPVATSRTLLHTARLRLRAQLTTALSA